MTYDAGRSIVKDIRDSQRVIKLAILRSRTGKTKLNQAFNSLSSISPLIVTRNPLIIGVALEIKERYAVGPMAQ